MTITSNKYYNQRRPSVSSRVTPEVKAELLKLQKDNGGSLGDTIADVIQKGLNRTNDAVEPISPIADVKEPNPDVDANAVIDDAFKDGYNACKIELKDKINSKLNGFNTDKQEKNFSCNDCGFEFNEKNKFCPSCGFEFNDDTVDDGGSDKKGIFEEAMDSINDIFSDVVGGDLDIPKNDNSGDINFVGGHKTVIPQDTETEYRCNKCGIEFDENLKFCPGCGIELIYDGSGGGFLDGLKKWNNGGG